MPLCQCAETIRLLMILLRDFYIGLSNAGSVIIAKGTP